MSEPNPHIGSELKLCGRCYDEADELFKPPCSERPEENDLCGQYHCPDCGAMLVGGIPHPWLCARCRDLKHPKFDQPVEEEA